MPTLIGPCMAKAGCSIQCSVCHTRLSGCGDLVKDDDTINCKQGDLGLLYGHVLIARVYCAECPNPIGYRVVSVVPHDPPCVPYEDPGHPCMGMNQYVKNLISIENNLNRKCEQLRYLHLKDEFKDMVGKVCLDQHNITQAWE